MQLIQINTEHDDEDFEALSHIVHEMQVKRLCQSKFDYSKNIPTLFYARVCKRNYIKRIRFVLFRPEFITRFLR